MTVGRPTEYETNYCEQARKLCLLGATDKDLAAFFEVEEKTINNWKNAHPEFLQSIKAAKSEVDAQVVRRLFERATGYSHDAVKIAVDANTGKHQEVPYTEHYPPDTTACIFWLKNRQPQDWRDKHEVEHGGGIDLNLLDPDQQQRAREILERMDSE